MVIFKVQLDRSQLGRICRGCSDTVVSFYTAREACTACRGKHKQNFKNSTRSFKIF